MKHHLLLLVFLLLACSHGCADAKKDTPPTTASANPPVPPREPLPCFIDSGQPAGSAISLMLMPSRVSGVAPLAVYFETIGTTAQASSRPFHDLAYCWDFGDPNAGNFATTGLTKNQGRGPSAGHVFETPGTYSVTVSARDNAGRVATQAVEITVDDPEEIFAGTATVCLSPDGNFDGCPAGADQITSSDTSDLSPHVGPGMRLLLARGGSFHGNLSLNTPGPGMVGAYGPTSAPRPHIAMNKNAFDVSDEMPNFSDWRIADLEISGLSSDSGGVYVGGRANDLLLLRLKVSNVGSGIAAPDSIINYWNANGSPGHNVIDGFTIADSDVRDVIGGDGHNLSYIAAHHLLMLGNVYTNSSGGEHVIRITWGDRVVFSDNDLSEAPAPRHLLKMHAPKFTEAGIGQGKYTEQVVLSDNVVRGTGGHDWSLAIGPQNEASDEHVRDVIVERNLFLPGPEVQVAVMLWGQSITVRDNLFNRGNQRTCVGGGRRGVEPMPTQYSLSHNTCYSEYPKAVLASLGGVTNLYAYNNLIAGPGATGTGFEGNYSQEAGNVVTIDALFQNPALMSWEDFELMEGSPAIDTGVPEQMTAWDYSGRPRPVDGDGSGSAEPDVGALERVP